jgi:hypothetical protein
MACPCDCKEISIQKQVFLSRTPAGANPIPVKIAAKKTVCNTTQGPSTYEWHCDADLSRLAEALNSAYQS